MELATYILTAMLYLSPLHHHINKTEDPAERLARYQSIAQDIVKVSMDPNERPAFKGKFARERTALLMASMAFHESGYSHAVDIKGKRGTVGEVCIMQVMPNMIGSKFNYSPKHLRNRENCLRAGLAIARASNCAGGLGSRMRAYVSGSCKKRDNPKSEKIIARAAYGEVSGYLRFYYKYPTHKYVKQKPTAKKEPKVKP